MSASIAKTATDVFGSAAINIACAVRMGVLQPALFQLAKSWHPVDDSQSATARSGTPLYGLPF